MAQRAGFNWGFFGKIFLLGAIGVTIWVLVPTAKCAFSAADAVELGGMEDDDNSTYNRDRQADAQRASEGAEFVGDMGGSVTGCWDAYGFNAAELWQKQLCGGLWGAAVLFLVISGLHPERKHR